MGIAFGVGVLNGVLKAATRSSAGLKAVVAAASLFATASVAQAQITITPLTWNVVGLDSNRPATDGPDMYMVGARVENVGASAVTTVTATFVWDSANPYINLIGPAVQEIPALAAGESKDFYYSAQISRTGLAQTTARQFRITATAGAFSASTPSGRELYVEKLVSQARNSIASMSIRAVGSSTDLPLTGPNGRTATVYVGREYDVYLNGSTAPGGYEQLVFTPMFPGDILRTDSAAIACTTPAGFTTTTLYGDACGWVHDPADPNYFTKKNSNPCANTDLIAGGKVGDVCSGVYRIRPIAAGTRRVGSLILDFSGSSFHYNGDVSDPLKSLDFVVMSTGTLTGKLFKDSNGNGLQDGGEAGMPNVDILVTDSAGTKTYVTDASGNYTVYPEAGSATIQVVITDPDFPPGSVLTTANDPQTTTISAGDTGVLSAIGYQPPAVVTGVVFRDGNGDGAYQSGEPLLPNIRVDVADSNGTTVSLLTGADGRYSQTLAPGNATAFVDENDTDLFAGSRLSTPPNPRTVSVASETTTTVDFGFEYYGLLTGHVFNDVNGNGTQDAGEPNLPGITVEILTSDAVLVTTETAANGSYEIRVPKGLTVPDVDESDSDAPAGAVVTTGNDPQNIDVTDAPSSPAQSVGLRSSGQFAGRVFHDENGNGFQDGSEAGLPDVTVILTDFYGATQSLTTVSNGDFSGTAAATTVTLDVDNSDTDLPVRARLTTANDPQTVVIPAGSLVTADPFGYQATSRFSGCVFDDRNGNGIQDAGEPGLSGIDITITDAFGGSQTTTTENGKYTVEVPPGCITPTIDESDVPAGAVRTTETQGALCVGPGDDPPPVPVGYQQRGFVNGRVFHDVNGNGIQDGSEPGLDLIDVLITDSYGVTQVVTTNPTGDYATSAAATAVVLDVDDTDTDLPARARLTTANDPQTTTVPAGATLGSDPVGYQATSTFNGCIFNDIDGDGFQDAGEPGLDGVQVTVQDEFGGSQTTTTESGKYSVDVPPGCINVDINAATLPAGSVQTTGSDGDLCVNPGDSPPPVPVGFQQRGILAGHVFQDDNGNAVQDGAEPDLANITVTITDSLTSVTVLSTDTNGDYTTSVVVGSATVVVDSNDADLPGGARLTTGNDSQTPTVIGGTVVAADPVGYQPTGVFSSCLFEDVNGNGVQDAGEGPLAGVDVTVTDALGDTHTTTTDENGCYRIVVPPGCLTADVDNSDLPPGSVLTTADEGSACVPPGNDPPPVPVGFQRRGVLSGHVFDDNNGNGVLDAGEQGLPNVTVTITDLLTSVTILSTDANGDYTTSVVAGSVNVDVDESDSDLPAGSFLTTSNDPQTTTVIGGAETSAEPFGFDQSGIARGHVFHDVNANAVQDAGEPDLPNVTIFITTSREDNQTTETDANGNYAIGVPGGLTEIDVDESDPDAPANAVITTSNDPQVISVSDGQNSDAEPVGLRSQAGIGGLVFEDVNGNSFRDSGEPGLTSITVTLVDSTLTTFVTETDSDGTYLFSEAAAGSVTVSVDSSDPELPAGATLTTANDTQTTSLLPGEAATAGPVGYQRRGTITGHVFNDLNGNGVLESGEPALSNITVVLTGSFGTSATVESDSTGNFSAFLPAGSVTLDVDSGDADLPTGAVLTTGNDPQAATIPAGSSAASSPFGFQSFGTLSGHVYRDSDGDGAVDGGEPGLANVEVLLTEAFGTTRTVSTDANGDFETSVPAGLTTADVSETDSDLPAGSVLTTGNDPQSVNVLAGQDNPATAFGFQPRGVLEGAVFHDLNGNGVWGVGEPALGSISVTLTDTYGVVTDLVTDSHGAYSATVAAVDVTVAVDSADPQLPAGAVLTTANNPQTITVAPASSTAAGDVGYQSRGSLTGLVFLDENGNAGLDAGEPGLGSVSVITTDAHGTTGSVLTDDTGFYTADLPAGTASVDVDESTLFPGAVLTTGNDPQSATVVGGDITFTPEVGYQARATVSGHVFLDLDRNGALDAGEPGLQAISVLVTDQYGTTQSLETDAQGDYQTSAAVGAVLLTVDDADADLPESPVRTTANNPQSVSNTTGGLVTATPVGYNSLLLPQDEIGTVLGRVFLDSNGNGTEDAGETGLAGITVRVTDTSGTVHVVETLASGDYSTTAIAGAASVNVDELDVDLPAGSVLTTNNDPQAVVIPANSTVTATPFGFVPKGTLAGRVYHDLNGDAVQSAGEPGLAGITVVVTDASLTSQSVVTNSSGDYSALVLEGAVNVDVDETDTNMPAGAALTTGNDPQAVTAVGNAATTIPAVGYQARGVLSGRVYADTNGNAAQDGTEAGLVNVTVTVTDSVGTVRPVVTDSTGDFTVTVAAGPATVDVDQNDADIPAPSRLTTANDPQSVSVAGGVVTPSAPFGFQRMMILSGVVFHDVNGNGAYDSGETGLSNIAVTVTDVTGGITSADSTSTGSYSFTVPYGTASVNVDDADPNLPAGAVLTTANDPQTVAPPATGEIASATPFGFQARGTVSGRVFHDVNGNGAQESGEAGLPNVTVVLTTSIGTTRTLVTGATGNWSDVVPAGITAADVDQTDPDLPGGSRLTTGNDPQTISVIGGSNAAMSPVGYQATGTVVGRVYEDVNGNGRMDAGEPGLPNITVILSDVTAPAPVNVREVLQVQSGPDGYYPVTVASGDVSVSVDVNDPDLPAGFFLTTNNNPHTVFVPAGEQVQTSPFGFHVRGTVNGCVFLDQNGDGVLNPGETGVPDISVLVTDAVGNTWPAVSGSDGKYSTPTGTGVVTVDVDQNDPDLPPGVVLTTNNDPQTVPVSGGSTSPAPPFGFQARGTLTGTVFHDQNNNGLREAGEPGLGNVSVLLTDAFGGARSANTGGDGTFSSVLPAGTVLIDVDQNDTDIPAGAVLTTGNDPQTQVISGGQTASATPVGYGVPEVARVADLRVTKTVTPERLRVGNKARFAITVTNDGPDRATGVVMTDPLPSGMTYLTAAPHCTHVGGVVTAQIGDLEAGQSRTVYINVAVVSAGSHTNIARATLNEIDPTPENNADAVTMTVEEPNRDADLEVVKTVSNSSIAVGSKVHFRISVTNCGPNDGTSVTVTDTLPPGLAFLASMPSMHHDNGVLTAMIDRLPLGHTRVFNVTCLATAEGSLTNQVSVAGNEGDPTPNNNSGSVPVAVSGPQNPPVADLALTKFVTPDPQTINGLLTYTLLVTNFGPDPTTACTITDALPEGVVAESVLVSQGSAVVSGQVVTGNLGYLPVGASATMTIHARATRAGTVCNTAVVTTCDSDPNPGNNAATICSGVVVPACADLDATFMTMDGVPTVQCSTENGVYKCQLVMWTEIHNRGNADAPPSRIRYYLSDDATLDPADSYVSYADLPGIRAGGHTMHDLFKWLPADVRINGRYLLVVVDATGNIQECNEGNNVAAFGPLDAPCANLVPRFKTLPDLAIASYESGQPHLLIWTFIKNTGNAPAPATRLRYYLSDDQAFDPADEYVSYVDLPAIKAGEEAPHDLDKRLPAGTRVGGRYVLGVADVTNVVPECSEGDNVAVYGPLEMPPAGCADLIPRFKTLDEPVVYYQAGQNPRVVIWTFIRNAGPVSAPPTRFRYYLSDDQAWDSGDHYLSYVDLPSIAAGAEAPHDLDKVVPAGVPVRGRYLLGVADATGLAAECDEQNNVTVYGPLE